MRILTLFFTCAAVLLGFTFRHAAKAPVEKLSDYGFFTGKLSDLNPSANVLPYTVRNPLFSNYAEKARFIVIPKGSVAVYNDTAVFDFPSGTVLIKNFYYPHDARNPARGKRILETRLLVKGDDGWEAFPYIWNAEQTEAFYDPAGETMQISYVNRHGKKVTTPYVVPNKNQCRSCHAKGAALVPIGLNARQLNVAHTYKNEVQNQLASWKALGMVDHVPVNPPAVATWDDPSSGDINERARSYLDANCAHCHSRTGGANTSGLYLDIFENDAAHLGVNKPPVAAGRGAGSMKFDIVPGQPQNSILVFRMRTNDPAIAMPEIGREMVHAEGVALIEEWIKKSTFASR
jgi:uncharacterized repeat protein (TIGR03806 family)